MSSFLLNWTPAGGLNSTGQQVQYKQSSSSTWITVTTVGPSTTTYTATGLLDNVIYDFQIVNLCTYGGPTSGTSFQSINLTCPTVQVTPTFNSASFSFSNLGGSVTEYKVDLLDASGSSVIASKNTVAPTGTISDSFTGLDPQTNYQIRVTVKAGTYTKQCPAASFATSPLPVCDPPTNLTGTIN
jgi:hypothetical protein